MRNLRENTPRMLPFNLLDVSSSAITEDELNVIEFAVWKYMRHEYKQFDKIIKNKEINEDTLLDLHSCIFNGYISGSILKRFNENYTKLNKKYLKKFNLIKDNYEKSFQK